MSKNFMECLKKHPEFKGHPEVVPRLKIMHKIIFIIIILGNFYLEINYKIKKSN